MVFLRHTDSKEVVQQLGIGPVHKEEAVSVPASELEAISRRQTRSLRARSSGST
jgi:hypothetical protein